MVKRSAFAVWRLMTSVYRAGRSMKEAGSVVGVDAIARSVWNGPAPHATSARGAIASAPAAASGYAADGFGVAEVATAVGGETVQRRQLRPGEDEETPAAPATSPVCRRPRRACCRHRRPCRTRRRRGC
jgi:hypothetical protein